MLLLSACFSSFETALFTFPRIKLQSYLRDKRRYVNTLIGFLSRPRRILVTLLSGNLLVNVGASSILTLIVINLSHQYQLNETFSLIIEFFLMTYILLLVGEITPKALAVKNYELITANLSPFMKYIHLLFTPISATLDNLTSNILPKSEIKKMSARDVNTMLQEAKSANIIETEELEIARQLLGLGKRTVSQTMTPISDVVGVPDNATVGEALKKVKRAKHSRLVVFEHDSIVVVGILYAKDIIFAEYNRPVRDYMREPHFIPETKNLETLLNEFRKRGVHIAMVNDEFGEFIGIVTLEDILESFVGEIIDEYDGSEDVSFHRLPDGSYLVDGDVTIHTVFHTFHSDYVDESGERLSAFILRNIGHIPKEGESFTNRGLIFTVREIKRRKIKKVLIQRQ